MWNLVQLIIIKSRVYIPNIWKYWKVSKSRQKKEENLLLINCSSSRQNYKSTAFFSRSSYHYNSKKKKKKNQHYDTRGEFKTVKATVNLRGIFWKKENCKMDETHSLNINSLLSWLNAKLRMCKGDINASGGKMMRFWAVCDVCEFAVFFFFFSSDCVPKPVQMGRKLKCSWLEVSEDRTWGWQRSLGINLISKRTYDLNHIDKIISPHTTWQLWRRWGIYKPERKKNGGEPWWPINHE